MFIFLSSRRDQAAPTSAQHLLFSQLFTKKASLKCLLQPERVSGRAGIKEKGIHTFLIVHKWDCHKSTQFLLSQKHRTASPELAIIPFPVSNKFTFHSTQTAEEPLSPLDFSLGNLKFSIQGALSKVGYLPMKIGVRICADNSG